MNKYYQELYLKLYRKMWYDFKRKILDRPTSAVNKDAVLTLMAKMECDMYLDAEKYEKKDEEDYTITFPADIKKCNIDEFMEEIVNALKNVGKLIKGQ